MLSASRLSLGVLAVSALTACAAKSGSDATTFTPQDSSAIAAEAEKWRSTTVSRDFDRFATTISDDVVMYPPNAAPLQGKDASMAFIKGYPTITKFELKTRETAGQGDVGYDHGEYALELKLPNGATAVDSGSFMSVFRRQTDGSWKHHRVMWHSNLPLPTPPAPTATRASATRAR